MSAFSSISPARSETRQKKVLGHIFKVLFKHNILLIHMCVFVYFSFLLTLNKFICYVFSSSFVRLDFIFPLSYY